MSIIDTIVSALRSLTGGGSEKSTSTSPSSGSRSEGQVSVEHEPDGEPAAPDTSTEAAVKGGDADSEISDDAAASGTDATASSETLVDEETGKEPAEAVAEPGSGDVDETADVDDGEADEPSTDEGEDAESAEVDEAEAADEADEAETGDETDEAGTEEDADDAEPAAEGSTESVETITGIGPAYAGRLEGIGIETVGELATADAAEVAEGIDVSESRVSDWIERANDAS